MTRELVRRAADAVLDGIKAGGSFGQYHLLLAHTAMSIQVLLQNPAVYTNEELGEFVRNGQGADLRAKDDAIARVAGHLLDAMGDLAMEALADRTVLGARRC